MFRLLVCSVIATTVGLASVPAFAAPQSKPAWQQRVERQQHRQEQQRRQREQQQRTIARQRRRNQAWQRQQRAIQRRRAAQQRRRDAAWQRRQVAIQRHRAARQRRYVRGHRYDGPRHVVRHYARYGLRAPHPGYHWIRADGGSYLLISLATHLIVDISAP